MKWVQFFVWHTYSLIIFNFFIYVHKTLPVAVLSLRWTSLFRSLFKFYMYELPSHINMENHAKGKKGNELVEHEGSERARVKICLLSLGGFAVRETCSFFVSSLFRAYVSSLARCETRCEWHQKLGKIYSTIENYHDDDAYTERVRVNDSHQLPCQLIF